VELSSLTFNVSIDIYMWWFLPVTCFCCLRVWVFTTNWMLLSALLSFLLLQFNTFPFSCGFDVLLLSLSWKINKFACLMPDQWFRHFIENPLVKISVDSGSWGVGNSCLDRDRNLTNLKRCHQKGRWKRNVGWVVEEVWWLQVLGAFLFISAVVVEGACVGDCNGYGVCTVGTVG
jgi:hypothetical protein